MQDRNCEHIEEKVHHRLRVQKMCKGTSTDKRIIYMMYGTGLRGNSLVGLQINNKGYVCRKKGYRHLITSEYSIQQQGSINKNTGDWIYEGRI